MTSMTPRKKEFPVEFFNFESSSFTSFLETRLPNLLPWQQAEVAGGVRADEGIPHGTTIVALKCAGGVVVAGDRRATMGNVIAQRDAEKVYPADEYSVVAYAGASGMGIEMIKLFQVELEHYEKLESRSMSFQGKANRLATLLRNNMSLAVAGLVVIPIFAGYDEETGRGRIVGYDYTGGRYEERDYHGVGSGSTFALNSLKKLYRSDMSPDEAVLAAVHALYDAADDDTATGGPDLTRNLFPIIATVTADGYRRLEHDEVAAIATAIVEERMGDPAGPRAPLR